MRQLEPRIVFDGAAAATAAEVAQDAPAPDAADAAPEASGNAVDTLVSALAEYAQPEPCLGPAVTLPAVVVFIDSAINDPGVLAAAVPAGAEIVQLDRSSDGLTQIALYLDGRTNIDAIHIISHGQEGQLTLGNAVVNATSIGGMHADELAIIKSALSENGDIALYGCNVAQGTEGLAFVEALSNATGADIAASDNDTGSATHNADWELETRLGLIEAGLIDAPEWNGILAPLDIRVTGDPATANAAGDPADPFDAVGNTALWTNAGTIGSTQIDIRATVLSTSVFNSSYPTYVDFITSSVEDLQVIIWNGSATIKWEIFASGTDQLVYAVGSPNFSIRDLDGTGTAAFPALPAIELEAVTPQLYGLTSYTVEGDPTAPSTLNAGIVGTDLIVAGTLNRNLETNSMVTFRWTEVSSWIVTYTGRTAAFNPVGSTTISPRFFYHDGDGDFTFASPNTISMLTIDLDANNSAATGTSYQTTFTENGAPVPVLDTDVTIAQQAVLGTPIHQATVRLTNPQSGDTLFVNGSTASSGTITVGTTTLNYTLSNANGYIDVVISGAAPPAEYYQALQAVTFGNSTDNLSGIDRQIEVFVKNTTFGTSSNQALTTIHVTTVNDALTAVSDQNETGSLGPAITGNVLTNDSDPDGDTLFVVEFQDDTGAIYPVGSEVTLPSGAKITINSNGAYTYSPSTGFSSLAPGAVYTERLIYSVDDGSNSPATVQFDIVVANPFASTPHLDLSGPSNYTGAFLYGHSTSPYASGGGDPAILSSIGNEIAGAGIGLSYDGSSVDVSQLTSTSLGQAIAREDYISMTFTTAAGIPETWIQHTVNRNAGGTYEFAIAISTDGFQTATLLSQNNSGNDITAPFYDGNTSYPISPATDLQLAANTTYEIRTYIYNATGGSARWDDFYVFYSNDPVNHEATFTEGGASVSISAATIEIEDADNTNLASGNILLTNKQTDDRLVLGSTILSHNMTGTVSGITYTVTETAGTIQIALSGSATKAAYAALINSIKFENTSDTPSTTDRTIDVSVSDGALTSNLATMLIHVLPVNDPPVADDEGPITAVPGTLVNVPVLPGDTDAEGDTLSVTGLIDPANPGTTIALTVGTPVTLASGTKVTLKSDGTLDVVMATGNSVTEAFQYVVSDGHGGTDAATVTLARDTDGDGVANNTDVDDDNDGILDTIETSQVTSIAYAADGDFELLASVAGAWSTFNGNVTSSGWFNGIGSADSIEPGPNIPASPGGGIYAQAGGWGESLYTDLTGLTVGASYTVSFYHANSGYSGSIVGSDTARWQVSFGAQSQLTNPQSFQGAGNQTWVETTFTFAAAAATQRLEFRNIPVVGTQGILALDDVRVQPIFPDLNPRTAMVTAFSIAWTSTATMTASPTMSRPRRLRATSRRRACRARASRTPMLMVSTMSTIRARSARLVASA